MPSKKEMLDSASLGHPQDTLQIALAMSFERSSGALGRDTVLTSHDGSEFADEVLEALDSKYFISPEKREH